MVLFGVRFGGLPTVTTQVFPWGFSSGITTCHQVSHISKAVRLVLDRQVLESGATCTPQCLAMTALDCAARS